MGNCCGPPHRPCGCFGPGPCCLGCCGPRGPPPPRPIMYGGGMYGPPHGGYGPRPYY